MKFLLSLLCCCSLFADSLEEAFVTTKHTAYLPQGELSYTATAGTLPVLGQEGDVAANIFFIAYTQKTNAKDRPVTFVFPGGPGGAGTVEAMAGFGPKRLLTPDEGGSVLPPYSLIDNPQTLLDVTDLVYIDPVSCGFSHSANEEGDLKEFYDVERDLRALAQFVRNYITAFQRWNSPKYLMGSSYGTLRCCGLIEHLLISDIYVHGIILQGCAFELSTLWHERDQALPDCLLIPTLAATAWYHGRLWPEKTIEEVVKEAKDFAFRQYALQAMCPSCFSNSEKETFFQQLALFTGLPLGTVQRYSGRINESIYANEFFYPERKVLGRKDSRYVGDVSSIDPRWAGDPSYGDTGGAMAALLHYLQEELDYNKFPGAYVGFSSEAFHYWNFLGEEFSVANLLQRLREGLIYNPEMKILVQSGYYDCRTPFAATEYCFDRIELPNSYKKNISHCYYEAGHGAIFDLNALKKMRKDLASFYKK